MGVNPVSFLVLPKILASLVMAPVLIITSIFLSLYSGYVFAGVLNLISGADFLLGIQSNFQPDTIQILLVKALVYGFLVSSISSFQGLSTQGGALEVGLSNTNSIVISSIAIITSEYLLIKFFATY